MSGESLRAKVRDLHRPVQYRGWRLWVFMLARDQLAFADTWCFECRKPWPCPTERAISEGGWWSV